MTRAVYDPALRVLALLAGLLWLGLSPGAARADEAGERAELNRLLHMDETLAIMRDEGLAFGAGIGADFLPDGGGQRWTNSVSRIYDPESMARVVKEGLARELPARHLPALIAFYASDVGQRLVDRELQARRAFLVPETEKAAREGWTTLQIEDETRAALITAYIEANDLIEFNVAGGLNSTLRFYRGLAEGGEMDMSDSEMLAEVWGQEADTRRETEEWLGGYLWVAYAGLPLADLQAYIDLSHSEAGRALNVALFAGFDAMYANVSYALGLAVATQMGGQDL